MWETGKFNHNTPIIDNAFLAEFRIVSHWVYHDYTGNHHLFGLCFTIATFVIGPAEANRQRKGNLRDTSAGPFFCGS